MREYNSFQWFSIFDESPTFGCINNSCYIIYHERTNLYIADIQVIAMFFLVLPGTSIRWWSESISSAPILGSYLIVWSTLTTHDQSGKYITVLSNRMHGRCILSCMICIHASIYFIPYFRGYQWWKYALHIDNFFISFSFPPGTFPVVVAIVPFIDRIPQKISNSLRCPFTTTLSRNIMRVVIIPDGYRRTTVQIHLVHGFSIRCFFLGMYRTFVFCIPVPSVGNPCAIPLPALCPTYHYVCDTLRCQFAL